MKNNLTNISILIPDGESLFLRSVVHCLSQIETIRIYIMTNDAKINMKYSRDIHKILYHPKANNETEWINYINKNVKENNIDLIMPINEIGIETLIKYKNLIVEQSKLGLLTSLNDFSAVANKANLALFLKKHQFPHPVSVVLNSENMNYITLPDFPIILKPLKTLGNGNGVLVCENIDAFKGFLSIKAIDEDYIVQNYISGYDIDCSVLCKEGNILACTIQKGIMFGETKFSPQIGIEFLHNEDLYKTIESFVKTLNWSGVAHVDLRYDDVTGDFKIIEVSPRFWQSLLGSLFAGVNFPHLYVLASLNMELPKSVPQPIRYYNLDGMVKKIKKDVRLSFDFNFLKKHTPLMLALKDPKPYIYQIIKAIF